MRWPVVIAAASMDVSVLCPRTMLFLSLDPAMHDDRSISMHPVDPRPFPNPRVHRRGTDLYFCYNRYSQSCRPNRPPSTFLSRTYSIPPPPGADRPSSPLRSPRFDPRHGAALP